MFGQRKFYEQAGIPRNAVTGDMVEAISRWCDLYEGRAPWLNKEKKNLGLPSHIASEIARMVTIEMEMNISSGGKGFNGSRAEYLGEQLEKVLERIQEQTEYACAKGGLVFKPYIDGKNIGYDFIQADDFYPCAYDSRGEITSAVFLARKKSGSLFYTRVEKHTLERAKSTNEHPDAMRYEITNDCFRSSSQTEIGERCQLTEVPEWATIDPVVSINDIDHPIFAYFRIPLGNTIDPKSPLGVSVYAKADQAGLLEEADKQFQRLMWEYEAGEMAVDASKDAFKTTKGEPQLPKGKERLFRMNTIDGQKGTQKLLEVFSPDLRDESYTNGLQTVLKQIEDKCGLSRGQLSDTEIEARTATEIKMAKQRTYATVTSIQKALEKALRRLVEASDKLATLYDLTDEGPYTVQFVWDDSVVVDAEAERQRDLEEVAAGIMPKWEYRTKWHGEDEETARKMIADSDDDSEDEDVDFFGNPIKQPVDPKRIDEPTASIDEQGKEAK